MISLKKTHGVASKRILFITPVLTYSGSPRSTLRMCKVALTLGYNIGVWSPVDGPFRKEYEACGIQVEIVSESCVIQNDVIKRIKEYDMAICNSIISYEFQRICRRYIPTVWYIREASNIPDYVKGRNSARLYALKHSDNIYCVSEYARDSIRKFTKKKIQVLHNCVEDEAYTVTQHVPGNGEKVRFIQLGTIDPRKGCDVLLSAFKSLPDDIRDCAELYFAGGTISSSIEYADDILDHIKGEDRVYYLGVLTGKEKDQKLAEMDVVVLASKDDAGSLVVLEGAMMSKPLIVTENVGTKYVVKGDNGYVVQTNCVASLKEAMQRMVKQKSDLEQMGNRSRYYYNTMASMEIYTKDMEKLFAMSSEKKTVWFQLKRIAAYFQTSEKLRKLFRYFQVIK